MTNPSGRKKYRESAIYRNSKVKVLALLKRVGLEIAAIDVGLHRSQLYCRRLKMRTRIDHSDIRQRQEKEIVCATRQLAGQAEVHAIAKIAAWTGQRI